MLANDRHDAIQGQILHVYDDIEEADNQLPRWWLITLFTTIVFGFGYWIWYQTFAIGENPLQAYKTEQLEALEKAGPVDDASLLAMTHDRAHTAAGESIFVANCASCHRRDASGDKGPNLTDGFWLHGGSPTAIYNTVSRGVTGKGMASWANLGGGRLRQVTAYVLTLRGTNKPGLPPQGQPYDLAAEVAQEATQAANAPVNGGKDDDPHPTQGTPPNLGTR